MWWYGLLYSQPSYWTWWSITMLVLGIQQDTLIVDSHKMKMPRCSMFWLPCMNTSNTCINMSTLYFFSCSDHKGSHHWAAWCHQLVPAGDLPGHLSLRADEDQGGPQGEDGWLQNWDADEVAEAEYWCFMVCSSQGSGWDKDGNPCSENSSEVWWVCPTQIAALKARG